MSTGLELSSLPFHIYNLRQDSVYDVFWIPRPPSDYPDRARSPSRGDAKQKIEVAATTEVKKPAAPYRLRLKL